jgi:hypothetical protein
MKKLILGTLVIILALAISACATGKKPAVPPVSLPVIVDDEQVQPMSWWAYRFRINWPDEQSSPEFPADLLLAHRVIRPVLKQQAGNIPWWRFHRRAARQPPGHQFSFIFYSDQATARNIFAAINDNEMLKAALKSGLVKSVMHSNTDEIAMPEVEDQSDRNWSPEIQRTWPTFIMGVSAFWLALIDDLVEEQEAVNILDLENSDVAGILDQYREVDDEIGRLWREEGSHSLLHHLGAVFGYKPMVLRDEVIF